MGAESTNGSNGASQTVTNGAANSKDLVVDTGIIDKNNVESTPKPSPTAGSSTRRGSINSHIEDKIGCCLEEFRCQHNNFTGILYVGPLGMVFLGRFLLFEWTAVLKWEEVTKVRRKASTPTAFGNNNSNNNSNIAIRIETSTSNPTQGIYDFEGFFDSQKTLETLIGLHNDSLLGNDESNMSQIITKRGSVIPLRRSNSNPAEQISNIFNFDDEPPLLTDKKQQQQQTQANPNKTTILDLRNQYSATNKVALQKIASAASPSSVDAPKVIRRDSALPTSKLTEEQLSEEWSKVCKAMDGYPEAPVCDKEVSLEDLDAFVETFVRDDAPYSWNRFMTEITGDMDVIATEWAKEPNNTAGVQALTRTIDYTHPVNAPMAPPTARARKEQTLKSFGNQNGLVVETKTIVSDVPMTDCFYVRDVLQVKRNARGRFVVNFRFEVVFVKSTMFRALISRTTTSEFRTIMNDLASWFCKHCGNSGTIDPPTEDPEALEESNESQPKTVEDLHPRTSGNNANTTSGGFHDFVWKFLVLGLLLWMAQMQYNLSIENGRLKEDLGELKSLLSELEAQRSTESRFLRDEWKEWKSTLVTLEQARSTEAHSLRRDLKEWKAELLESESSRATETQSFWDELVEWRSSLLGATTASKCPPHPDADDATSSDSDEEGLEDDLKDRLFPRKAASIPRQGTASGIGGPLKVEPVQQRGGYRNAGQKATANLDQLNDWEKLEQCNDCY